MFIVYYRAHCTLLVLGVFLWKQIISKLVYLMLNSSDNIKKTLLGYSKCKT